MPSSKNTITDADIACANLGWMVAQMLLGTLVTKKILEPKDAKELLEYCQQHYRRSNNPQRSEMRASVLKMLEPLIAQYSVPPESQRH